MNVTIEKKKEKAVDILKTMNIFKPYIDGFKENDQVCFYENYAGFWVYQEPEIEKKMREIEQKYNCKVYAITHEYTNFGELYDFLFVSDYPDEWEYLIYSQGNMHTILAYVWNIDDDCCSELGSITVKSFGGGIKRIV